MSLIELGAGFNPDFSAHDNILMNAAMHGIPKREALERMDEIIQFAELDQFIDNPLRHYSSGMYLRLAFSVAISMQPDLLLADEILAVGDMAFQERCLERVAQEAERGLTVLFVSHAMAAVSRLCHRIVWLDKGEVVRDGARYGHCRMRRRPCRKAGGGLRRQAGRHSNIVAEIGSVRLLNASGEKVGAPRHPGVVRRDRHEGPCRAQPSGCRRRDGERRVLFRAVQPDSRSPIAGASSTGAAHSRRPPCGNHLYAERHRAHPVEGDEGRLSERADVHGLRRPAGAQFKSSVRSGVIGPRLDWYVRTHEHAARTRKATV